jgi:hypothetical protein
MLWLVIANNLSRYIIIYELYHDDLLNAEGDLRMEKKNGL